MKTLEEMQIQMCPHKPSYCLSTGKCPWYVNSQCCVADHAWIERINPKVNVHFDYTNWAITSLMKHENKT